MTSATLSYVRPAATALLAIMLCALGSAAHAWERPHADGPNSGFANVITKAADAPITVPGIGTFAAGSGPVIAADGTVYLGNQQGQLMALGADGTRGWTSAISPGHSIVASPVVDSEGSIYVIGTRTVRNTLVDPPLVRYDAALYKFSAGGNLLWRTPFPNGDDGPTTSAPPNIWKSGGAEVLMAPVYYPNKVTGGYDARLVAVSKAGAILHDVRFVTMLPYAIPGGSDNDGPGWCVIPVAGLLCELMPDFNPSGDELLIDPATRLPEGTVVPRPGVAVFTYDSPGTPFVLVSDQQQDLVAYTFVNNRFNEIFRLRDDRRWFRSPPMVLPDGHTMIATKDLDGNGSFMFAGPNMTSVSPITGVKSFAAPTRMRDGRIAIVGHDLEMKILRSGNAPGRTIPLPGESIASAAASRSHLFVSTAGSFLTYDASTLQKTAEIFWVGGGQITPAIGPFGHVYGMASNVLFVFLPPPSATEGARVAAPDTNLVIADPATPEVAPQSSSQHFSGPLTNAGHRLFACQELDGDDCGKSTNKAVALAFCQQQGFTQVDKVDTETRKGKAARLDGQFCTKNKCEVFDEIVCRK